MQRILGLVARALVEIWYVWNRFSLFLLLSSLVHLAEYLLFDSEPGPHGWTTLCLGYKGSKAGLAFVIDGGRVVRTRGPECCWV